MLFNWSRVLVLAAPLGLLAGCADNRAADVPAVTATPFASAANESRATPTTTATTAATPVTAGTPRFEVQRFAVPTGAVYVDERDAVWLSDFGANALVRYDHATGEFKSFPLEGRPGNVRQIHGRPGEVWAPESAADHIVVVRTLPNG